MAGQWGVSFNRWYPAEPGDGRSPWLYMENLDEGDRFTSASEAAFTALERRVYDPFGDGYRPLFKPVLHDRRH